MKLTRRYRFCASHRLHAASLSEGDNARIYGKCNNPFGHGHDYVLEVTIAGTPDPQTGLIVPISKLDRLVQEAILRLFAHSNINLDVPQFARLVPTTENLVLVITKLLEQNWKAYLSGFPVRLDRVHIQETARNGFELLLNVASKNKIRKRSDALFTESITLHA